MIVYLYQIPLIKKSEMFNNFKLNTRMHSSTMRTTHSSTSQVCVGSASVRSGIQPLGCGPGDPPRCRPGDPTQMWACRYPRPDPSTSPWVWALRPPQPDPSTSPLGVGLETCMTCLDTPPSPWDLQGMLGYYPPYGQTDTCKNITFVICRR